MSLSEYNYALPKELIAHEPAEPRDASRLFVYSTKTDEVVFDVFSNIARYIPAHSLVVLNNTQVVPARLELSKITGGMVRVLFLFNEWNNGPTIKGLPDRKIAIGESLFINHRACVEAVSQINEEFTFKLLMPVAEFEKIMRTFGRTPLPPYIDSVLDEQQARARYQTIFATAPASVAAPTAALHFTERVIQSLSNKGIGQAYVTLHVGRGTFSPVTDADIASGTLHSEPISVSQETSQTIVGVKKAGGLIVSSGTTATRLLETAAPAILAGQGYTGETSLFIKPPYPFKVIDAMITNFHLPGTSLIMLVDAFLQSKNARQSWKDLYELAIREQFRFYSFGDAMLII